MDMNTTTRYTLAAAAAVLLTACSAGDDMTAVNGDGPVIPTSAVRGDTIPLSVRCVMGDDGRETSGWGGTTRTFTSQDETHVTAGRTVYFWADEHLKPLGLTLAEATDNVAGSPDCREYIAAWALQSNGAGSWTGSPTTQYYTPSGYPIDLYALCGNFHDKTFTAGQARDNSLDAATTWEKLTAAQVVVTDPASGEVISRGDRPLAEHTVKDDQSLGNDKYTDTGAFAAGVDGTSDNYFASDLLYGRGYDREPQVAAQPVIMSHLMSKIEAYLILGDGLTADNIVRNSTHRARVSVVNTLRTARLTLRKQVGSNRQEPNGRSGDAASTDYFDIEAVEPYDAGYDEVTDEDGTHQVPKIAPANIECLMQYNKSGESVSVPNAETGVSEVKTAYAKAEAIVVPQYVADLTQATVDAAGNYVIDETTGLPQGAQDVAVLNIVLPADAAGDGTLTYQFRAKIRFKPGCRYVFYITLKPTPIDIQVTVVEYTNNDRTGNLIIQ